MSTPRCQDIARQGQHFWQSHTEALAQSGLSRREYCLRYNLSYHAMTYWVRKHSQSTLGTSASVTLVEVPVRLPTLSIPLSTPLRLHTGSGYMVELDPNFDEATLARLLAVLEQGR
jgi:hypothetical protein